MVTVRADRAASMQGPKPASYCRASRWAASEPVKATLKAFPSWMRVTDTSTAPGIVSLASSATRVRVCDSGWASSMILLSSAKAARASRGGEGPAGEGVTTAVLDSRSLDRAIRPRAGPGKTPSRAADEWRPGRGMRPTGSAPTPAVTTARPRRRVRKPTRRLTLLRADIRGRSCPCARGCTDTPTKNGRSGRNGSEGAVGPDEREGQGRADGAAGQQHEQSVDAEPEPAGGWHGVGHRLEEGLVELHRLRIARGRPQRLLGQSSPLVQRVDQLRVRRPQ